MRLEEVPTSYDRAAKWYDVLTGLVFGGVLRVEQYRRHAVEALGEIDGATVLDVGCGTGRNFPLLVPRVGARGRIVGIDYSNGMLERARRRVDARGWPNVELIRGDAVTLENVPDPVDAVVSVWCLGIVYDLEAALERIIDVLRPGGALAILDFQRTRPERGWLRRLYPLYSAALIRAGIDTAADLDDAKLRARWRRGRDVLESNLTGVEERTYLYGTGLLLHGRKPGRLADR